MTTGTDAWATVAEEAAATVKEMEQELQRAGARWVRAEAEFAAAREDRKAVTQAAVDSKLLPLIEIQRLGRFKSRNSVYETYGRKRHDARSDEIDGAAVTSEDTAAEVES